MSEKDILLSEIIPSENIYMIGLFSEGSFEDKRIIVGEHKADIYYKSITFKSFKDPSNATNEKAIYRCYIKIDEMEKTIRGFLNGDYGVREYLRLIDILKISYKVFVEPKKLLERKLINKIK